MSSGEQLGSTEAIQGILGFFQMMGAGSGVSPAKNLEILTSAVSAHAGLWHSADDQARQREFALDVAKQFAANYGLTPEYFDVPAEGAVQG